MSGILYQGAGCHQAFDLKKSTFVTSGPAEYYTYKKGMVGFIKTTKSNCAVCSRLRLTSTGELKSCLYQPQGLDLRALLRGHSTDEDIREIAQEFIAGKENINFSQWECKNTYMSTVGG